MDVFRFTNPNDPARMEQGRVINGIKSKMWVERYGSAGEFKFVGDVRTGIHDLLPIGSFVSHIDTYDIMQVENHEINETKDKESEIIITGRGYETIYEQRIVGDNYASFPVSGSTNEYQLGGTFGSPVATQIRDVVAHHAGNTSGVGAIYPLDPADYFKYIIFDFASANASPTAKRTIKYGDVYTRILELMKIQNIGVKVLRPGPWNLALLGSAYIDHTVIALYLPQDKSNVVMFSVDTGEIESASYLWSNKPLKNCALVIGKWVRTRVNGPEANLNRRIMLVEASDIDDQYSSAPTGADLAAVNESMQQRGQQALATQVEVALTKAEVSKNNVKAKYRKDYNLGDIITVNGSYNASSKMRVTEYVEIEDETGMTAYPTLTLV